jgi:hypothetical protein
LLFTLICGILVVVGKVPFSWCGLCWPSGLLYKHSISRPRESTGWTFSIALVHCRCWITHLLLRLWGSFALFNTLHVFISRPSHIEIFFTHLFDSITSHIPPPCTWTRKC